MCELQTDVAWVTMQDALDKAILKDQRSDIKHAVLSVHVCRKQSELHCTGITVLTGFHFKTVYLKFACAFLPLR